MNYLLNTNQNILTSFNHLAVLEIEDLFMLVEINEVHLFQLSKIVNNVPTIVFMHFDVIKLHML